MEKRYQVFISSTFQDLQNARQEVSQALLRADCFPAGMELFPAADEQQFEFIKTKIDQSDYYILISAGRYGSIHPETGLSYTEMEYNYAVEIGKPVIRLLHADPLKKLKGEAIEQTDIGKKLLMRFRETLVSNHLVRFWTDPMQLGSETQFALADIQKRSPTQGWVKANDLKEPPADSLSQAFKPENGVIRAERVQSTFREYEYRNQKLMHSIFSSLNGIEARLDDFDNKESQHTIPSEKAPPSKEVFIVHGHDEEAKGKTQLCLMKLGLQPIVLHEQANEGQTIIEKFERHSNDTRTLISQLSS